MKTIFASRWKALWFFAVVMLTAYCSIPEAADTPGNDAAGQKQVEQVDSIIQHLKQSSDNLEQYKREHPE